MKSLKEILAENEIFLSEDKLKKFEKYYEILVFYNEKFNITAITEREEVYIKHFCDSLIGIKYFNCENVDNLIDVGAGGGFPSVPILIAKENIKGTLLEATGKKCEFLKTVVKELDLKKVNVICDRAENAAKNPLYREKFDLCVSRAVARLNTLTEYCLPFVKKGGDFIAYKGEGKEEIIEAENAIKILGGKIEKISETLLYGAKRTIIDIKKVSLTEKKYPRGNGKERKSPL